MPSASKKSPECRKRAARLKPNGPGRKSAKAGSAELEDRPSDHRQVCATVSPGTQTPLIARVISGGQTGVDRGALDAALAVGVPHGGWCPKGRLAEDGPIPRRYRLRQTRTPAYHERTFANVRDSDATLILADGPLAGGTRLTAECARQLLKPLLIVDLAREQKPLRKILRWLKRLSEKGPIRLNVAGPRASQANLYASARDLMERLLKRAAARKIRSPGGSKPPLPRPRRRR